MSRGEKNVEVTFFANVNLKHKAIVLEGKTVDAYPLYVLVQYGRSNTTFKVEIENNQFLVTKDLEQLKAPDLAGKISIYKRTIFDLIALEERSFHENFTLKGFGTRVRKYHLTVSAFLKEVSAARIFDFFQSRENTYIMQGHKFLQYSKLMNEFEHIVTEGKNVTALDWHFKDGKNTVYKILTKNELKRDELVLSNGELIGVGVPKEYQIESWMLFIDSLLLINVF